MKKKSLIGFLFLVSLFFNVTVFATDYYVAPNGNDSNNGLYPSYQGSNDGPFKTINRASQALSAGDVLYIREGKYQEAVNFSSSGTEENIITVKNYLDENAIIDGDNYNIPSYGNALIKVTGSWYYFSGIEIVYSGDYGFFSRGSHVTVDNLKVHHNWGGGITLTGDYNVAQNCYSYSNSLKNENMKANRWGYGITCARYPKNCTIKNCVVYDNWGEGVSTFEAYNTTIEDNIVYNNQANIYLSDTQNTVCQRNLSYFTEDNPIRSFYSQVCYKLGDEKYNPQSANNKLINNLGLGGKRVLTVGPEVLSNTLIANNVFVNSYGDYNTLFYSGTPSGTAQFTNNIILQENNVTISTSSPGGILFTNNIWSKEPSSSVLGENSIVNDPKLTKNGSIAPGLLQPDYFKVNSDSVAIDNGLVLSDVVNDFLKRPRGQKPDIGSFEHEKNVSITLPQIPSGIRVKY